MKTITQIKTELTTIKDKLRENMELFNLFFKDKSLAPDKIEKLKKLNTLYSQDSYIKIIDSITNDKLLVNNIVNAVFFDLWSDALDFFDIPNKIEHDKKFNNYKITIIQSSNDIEFYLNALERFRYNLNNLHIFFTMYGIPATGKWPIEKYGINLDFNDLLLDALKESDLTKRKELVLKELHSAELFRLDGVEPEDFEEFDSFIKKCHKTIESIDFQMKNTTILKEYENENSNNKLIEVENIIPNKNPKAKQKQKTELIDFLLDKSKIELLLTIQTTFRAYEGKRLAILIHLLQKENKLIKFILNSKTHSRKHFICMFKEDDSITNTEAVGKYLNSYTEDLNLPTIPTDDFDYNDVKEKLTEVLENSVV